MLKKLLQKIKICSCPHPQEDRVFVNIPQTDITIIQEECGKCWKVLSRRTTCQHCWGSGVQDVLSCDRAFGHVDCPRCKGSGMIAVED